ncbi:MAG TPA: FlgD immunoglobulin-like domain containing protein [Bacteroidota bacterium]|nr:FlgD immunoglobulin-like domain containing protein [Bacteroidota bacterium]
MAEASHFVIIALTVFLCCAVQTASGQAIGTPALSSPANGSTDEPLSVELSWQSASGASSYELQVSTSSSFSTTVFDQSNISGTSQTVGSLVNGTSYYWRVRGLFLTFTSSWSDVWSFTTIPSAPTTPTLSAPSDNSLNQPTAMTFSWNSVPTAAGYRFQLSTDSTFASTLSDQTLGSSTSTSVGSLLENTKYFWRVDASNAGGTSSWSSVWNFTTVPPAPSAPVLAQPANNSTNQPTGLTLQWNISQNANDYRVEVSTDPAFSAVVVNQDAGNTTSSPIGGLDPSQKYYWRVDASNAGGTSAWSSIWNFTTVSPAPSAPVLLSPSNNAIGQPTNLTVAWNTAQNALSYRVQISSDSIFASLVIDSTTGTSTSTVAQGLSAGKTYFWRVNGSNGGGAGPWSNVWRFSTNTSPSPPQPPLLASPANASVNQPVTALLVWRSSVSALSYKVQASYHPDLSSSFLNDSSFADTTCQVGSLLNDTVVYWRVAAANNAGQSGWSGPWSFRTIPAQPAAPSPASPASGAVVDSTTVVVAWNGSQNASSYRLQVSSDSLFGSSMYDDSGLTTTSQQVSGLQHGAKYFWRVNAKNSGGTSSWSQESNFVTSSSASSGPSLISPSNGSVNEPTTVVFQWNDAQGSSSFELQVSADPNFGTTVYDNSSITSASQQVSSLKNGTTYYWRVRSLVLLFSSDWSTTWEFATIPAPPSAPALVSPANGAVNQSATPQLVWESSSLAATYHLQLSSQQNFSVLIADDSLLADTAQTVGPLAKDSTYFWRVSAKNAGGSSGWSGAWNFKTADLQPPILTSPLNGASVDSTQVSFVWSAVQNASSYWFQMSPDSTFGSIANSDSGIVSTSLRISGLQRNTRYFWRLSAFVGGQQSAWSLPNSFTVKPLTQEAGPNLLSPSDNSSGLPTTVTFSWSPDSEASSYELQLARDQAFDTLVYDDSALANTSQQVGALQNQTRYYWRVRALRSSIVSEWSLPWSFTTVQKIISTPALVAPINGSQNEPLGPTLQWTIPSGGITNQVQVGTDTTYSVTVFNDSTITADSVTVGPLAPNTFYVWRVRTKTADGWSLFSTSWNFTTTSEGAPSAVTDSVSHLATTSVTLNGTVNADGLATVVRFHYGMTSAAEDSVDGVPSPVSGYLPSAISSALDSLQPNTKYFYRITATNSAGTSQGQVMTFTTSLPAYPAMLNANPNIYFPDYQSQSQYKPADYRIVGLPGASNIRIDSLLSGAQDIDWDVYWDDGSGSNTLTSFDRSNNFVFSCGRAFWMIKKGNWAPALVVPAAPLDSTGCVQIPVHAGWNLITNPFLADIGWASVQNSNGISDPLYEFNGSFALSTTFSPYAGYYYFNSGSVQFLKIPYASVFALRSSSGPTSLPKRKSTGWKIQITMTTEGMTDSTAWLGTSKQSPALLASVNFHKPARFSAFPSVYFDRPEWDSTFTTFASDIRPSFNGEQSWKFDVWSPDRKQSTLRFSGMGSIDPQFEAYLLDISGKRTTNLREDSVYSFSPGDRTSEFLVAIGVKASVDKVIESLQAPREFSLGLNYPNPFNPQTTIPVDVPVRSVVELEVYNILGQRIRSLYSGAIEPGKYWFTWDGKSDEGNSAATGVYIYHLESSTGISMAKKMLLIK